MHFKVFQSILENLSWSQKKEYSHFYLVFHGKSNAWPLELNVLYLRLEWKRSWHSLRPFFVQNHQHGLHVFNRRTFWACLVDVLVRCEYVWLPAFTLEDRVNFFLDNFWYTVGSCFNLKVNKYSWVIFLEIKWYTLQVFISIIANKYRGSF